MWSPQFQVRLNLFVNQNPNWKEEKIWVRIEQWETLWKLDNLYTKKVTRNLAHSLFATTNWRQEEKESMSWDMSLQRQRLEHSLFSIPPVMAIAHKYSLSNGNLYNNFPNKSLFFVTKLIVPRLPFPFTREATSHMTSYLKLIVSKLTCLLLTEVPLFQCFFPTFSTTRFQKLFDRWLLPSGSPKFL